MSSIKIQGGRPLRGTVEVPGSKNASLALLSAVALSEGPTILHNVPQIADTRAKGELLRRFGAEVEWREKSMIIDCSHLHQGQADEETVRSIRTSFFLMGPLLARMGKVEMAAPGGCKIGARPVDFHIKGLTALGATIDFEGGVYRASAKSLRGAEIYLDLPSPGATQHLMTTAVLAEGHTVITNAAMEPEVVSLAHFLNQLGARIEGAGTNTITVHGVTSLHAGEYRVPADRMQAGTYLLAGAITGGDVTVTGLIPEHLTALTNKLAETGLAVEEGHDWIRVIAKQRPNAVKLRTMPYPGFATDLQQPMAALMAISNGTSVIDETIYEARIGHISELVRMGADIRLQGQSSIITGVEKLHGATVEASDLRAGASLILAGLAAEGETQIRNVRYIDRGYENIEALLNSLGAQVQRNVTEDSGTPRTESHP